MGYRKEYKSSNSISATCHTFQTTKLHLWVFTRKNPSVHSSSITLALFRVTAGAGSYPSWNGLLAYQSLILWSWTWRSLSLSSRPFWWRWAHRCFLSFERTKLLIAVSLPVFTLLFQPRLFKIRSQSKDVVCFGSWSLLLLVLCDHSDAISPPFHLSKESDSRTRDFSLFKHSHMNKHLTAKSSSTDPTA